MFKDSVKSLDSSVLSLTRSVYLPNGPYKAHKVINYFFISFDVHFTYTHEEMLKVIDGFHLCSLLVPIPLLAWYIPIHS